MHTRLLFAALIALLITACTTYKPPVKRELKTERLYEKSYDQVWNNVIDWFAKNNIPIKTLDKSSGLIATEFNLRNNIKESCDCGTSGFGVNVSPNIIGNFNVLIRRVEASTGAQTATESIRVNVSAFYKTKLTTSSFTQGVPDQVSDTDCESTGHLETAILDQAGR